MGALCDGHRPRFALAAFALGVTLLVGSMPNARAEPMLSRTDTGQAVSEPQLESVLPESGVLARLGDGDHLTVFGTDLVAQGRTEVFLSLSSQSFAAASLIGTVKSGTETADSGQVLVVDLDDGKPKTYYFDVERFLATSSTAEDPEIRSALEDVAASHESLKFWGLLQAVGVNAQAPVSPAVEEARRGYLLTPTVVRLRAAAGGDEDQLARMVAKEFAQGLAAKDLEPVRSLLSPDLFQSETRPYDRKTWRILRSRFAKAMIDGPLPRDLADATVEATGTADQFRVIGRQRTYILSMTRLDGMVFVKGLEPAEETS